MTERETGESAALSDLIRRQLVHGFGDYHTPIREQITLVDQLIEAVREEERERCAAIAERMGREPWPSKVERLGKEIADAIRTGEGTPNGR